MPASLPDSTAARKPAIQIREFAGPPLDQLIPPQTNTEAAPSSEVAQAVPEIPPDKQVKSNPPSVLKTESEAPVALAALAQPVTPDTAKIKDQKAKAKVLEAMPPENAAKILANLSDDESRELLKYVKTRQAAKILAAIQPERASRLLR